MELAQPLGGMTTIFQAFHWRRKDACDKNAEIAPFESSDRRVALSVLNLANRTKHFSNITNKEADRLARPRPEFTMVGPELVFGHLLSSKLCRVKMQGFMQLNEEI